jgi:aminoglycoside phosphotransferase (APT) family kinase protein
VAPRSIEIDEALVRGLIADQYPDWAQLPVHAVVPSGWDNRTFRVGNERVARLPSAAVYEAQVHREQRWLPFLAAHLPIEIPQPLALGRPGRGYPWCWSIYRWIPGDAAAASPPGDIAQFTEDLARFLNALQDAPAHGGPRPGSENFHRGGALTACDAQFRHAVATLGAGIDRSTALAVWDTALASRWSRPPVWVHGDVALGNLLVRDGGLAAVIDFGQVCVGDPACDTAIAWTYLAAEQRGAFRARLQLDPATWQRGRAWALWKAAVVAAGLVETNTIEGRRSWQTIDEVFADARAESA